MHLIWHTECYGDLDGDRCVWQWVELSDHDGQQWSHVHNLVPGTYTVTFNVLTRYVQNDPCRSRRRPNKRQQCECNLGSWGAITLTSGEVNTTIDAGYRCSQWEIMYGSGNGTQDAGGVNGITVQL